MVTCVAQETNDAGKLGPMLYVAFRFVLTDHTPLVSASEGIESLLGFTQQDFLSAKVSLKDRVHGDDACLVDSLISPDLHSPSGPIRLRLRHANGKILCTCGHYKKERAGDGTVTLELHLADARTVNDSSDATLINSFKSLIEHTADYIYVKNRNHVMLAASPTLANLNGAAGCNEIVGSSDYDIHSEEAADLYYALEETAFSEGRRVNRIHEISLRDGAKRWIDNRKYPINGPDGKIIGIFGVVADITDFVETRDKLQKDEHLLRLFIEHAPAALAMFDREMRYLAASRRWLEMYSLQEPDIMGRSHYEVMPEVPQAWREEHRRCLAGEPIPADERQLIRANGSVQWLRREILPWRTSDGAIGGILIFAEDITQWKQAEAEARDSKVLLRHFVEHAPARIVMLDREMRYLAVSRRFLEDNRLTAGDVIGRSHYETLPLAPERWKEAHLRALAGEAVHPEEDFLSTPDGGKFWLRREIQPWFKDDGSVGGIVILAYDITAQKQAEERLRLAATVFTGAREGIIIADEQGTILDVNDAFTRITGYAREEVLGRNPRMLNSGLQSREFYEHMWNCLLRDGHWSGELWNRSKSGDIYPAAMTVNVIRDANGKTTHYVALFSDISEVKEHEQQLEHISHFDALTGLPNRALFADRLRQAMGQARRSKYALAAAHFDLDGFKAINDKYGQTVGDGLLTAIAFRMKHALREGDTLARLGGDEFAAVILGLDCEDAVAPALNRLLEAVSEEARIGDVTLRVTASAGVTFYPQTDEVDADVLLRQGGQAMYQAKLAGGNCYAKFDPGQDLIARSRHENLEHIRQGLAAQRFVLYYQPIVNMRSGHVVGVEALVRWQHTDRGLLPPGLFLPVIEDHPLLVELGQWVIESALAQSESWKSAGLDLTLSVNVSAIELQQLDFVDRLRGHLAAHPQVQPSSLALEVVETSALQDVMQTSQVLTACRELGVSIALDDFGVGYSSLTYLRRLPANILKIDQSFVRDMLEDPENLNVLEGVMGLASVFRREVIVEGVETVDHGLMLLQLGCEVAQGYGIARPMPAEEFPKWIASWRPDSRWAGVPQVHATNRPVLYACVEHRAWLSAFEACLQGRRSLPPSLDGSQCRIATWIDAEKRSARGTLASIQTIDTLHRRLHGLAAEILESQADGRNPDGLARLEQLHFLHDECLSRVRRFTRVGRGGDGKRNGVAVPSRSRVPRG